MKIVAELFTKEDYNQEIVKPMLSNPNPEVYWTEIQWLDDGKFDLVSCRVQYGTFGWEVYRWWHSQQHGYWKTMEECVHHAMNFRDRKFVYVVDMRKEA